jgi:hypothetical protein
MAWDRNSANYPRPVAQFDATGCWAAGLEWWLKCMKNSRTLITQLHLIPKFSQYWEHDDSSDEYGTVTGENLGHIMDDASINMKYVVKAASTWDKDFVNEKLAISPVLIGYHETEVNGFHVNIIHSLNDTATGDVNVMDPNKGRFRTRSHIRFTTRNYVLGWAK